METKPKRIIDTTETVYQRIAKKYQTSSEYVGKINRGFRQPTRGKGLKILNELKKLTENKIS